MKIPVPLSFTDRQLDQIARALPKGANPHRLRLLPQVLREWAGNYLEEYATLGQFRPRAVEEGKRLKKIIAAAAALSAVIDAAIEAGDLNTIAFEMGDVAKAIPMGDRREYYINKIMDQRAFLNDLIAGIESVQKRMKSSRGQPRNTTAYMVLMDIAAIYEWVTGLRAYREVSRRNRTEIGRFYHFAAAIWPVVFCSADDGLPAAIRNWSSARKNFREASPLLFNIRMEHPSWGVFDS
jgi:hypothetical protein